MNYVPPVRTYLTPQEAATALMSALGDQLGGPVSAETLSLALAHCAFETGNWKHCYNYNWGNIKAGGTYDGPYTCLGTLANPVSEVLDGKERWFIPSTEVTGRNGTPVGQVYSVPPGHPQTRFRTYVSALPGAQSYVRLIATSSRYVSAWQALQIGDTAAFVRELKAGGYFTAGESRYLAGVTSLRDKFYGDLKGGDAPAKGWPLPLFFS